MFSRSRILTYMTAVAIVFLLPLMSIAQEQTGVRKAADGLTLGEAIVLGAVEGLTEYLPVSSTGHLLVAERLLGIGDNPSDSTDGEQGAKEAADAYAICIQAGAIIAVLGLYYGRVKQMIMGLFGRDKAGLSMAINVLAAFLPAAVIGLSFNKTIKAYLFGMWPVVAAWLIGGILILVLARSGNGAAKGVGWGRPLDQLKGRMALMIGLMQCIAMWPGVSRSLVTILGGMVVGLSLPAAVEFSFLLGVVTLGAATVHDAYKHGHVMLQNFDMLSMSAGLLAAFIFAVISVKWMVAYLNRNGLEVFGYYRIAAAVVIGVLLMAQVI